MNMYMKFLEKQSYRDRMQTRLTGQEWGLAGNRHTGIWENDKSVLKLMVVMAAQLYKFTKNN